MDTRGYNNRPELGAHWARDAALSIRPAVWGWGAGELAQQTSIRPSITSRGRPKRVARVVKNMRLERSWYRGEPPHALDITRISPPRGGSARGPSGGQRRGPRHAW